MSSIHNIITIFKKEFLQTIRNSTVMFTNLVIPLFGIPLYLILVSELTLFVGSTKLASQVDKTVFNISYHGDISKELETILKKDSKLLIKTAKKGTYLKEQDIKNYQQKHQKYKAAKANFSFIPKKKDIEKKDKETLSKMKIENSFKKDGPLLKKDGLIFNQNLDKVFTAKQEYIGALKILKQGSNSDIDLHIAIYTDSNNILNSYFFYSKNVKKSKDAQMYIKQLFRQHEKSLIKKYKNKYQIKKYYLDPMVNQGVNLSQTDEKVSKAVGFGLGGMIIFLLLTSLYHPSINTTIGEREQNTYKILLMNPISPHEIFIGKYLNIALQGFITIIPYAIQGIIAYTYINSKLLVDLGISLSPLIVVTLTLAILFCSLLISAVCFLTASLARSRVQAQSLMTIIMFIIMFPFIIALTADLKLSLATSIIPMINLPLTIENLLFGTVDYLSISIGILTNIIVSLLIIWFSLDIFLVQWKDYSNSKSISEFFSRKGRKSTVLMPVHAIVAFTIALIGYLYGSSLIFLLRFDIFLYIFTPILFCFGTTLLVLKYSDLKITKVITWSGLNLPYSAVLLLKAFFLSVFFQLIISLSGITETITTKFPSLFQDNSFMTGVTLFFIFALIPGVTEEILFRGVIYKGLRYNYGKISAMVMSSVLFAALHFSMFKWGHTFFVGLILAYIYEKKGLFSAILFHILFNLFGIFLIQIELFKNIIYDTTAPVKVILLLAITFLALSVIRVRQRLQIFS